MERERFLRMRSILRQMERHEPRNRRLTHAHHTIVLVAFWATLHDRPIQWAINPRHWPADLRPKPLPSQSCMSRRMRTFSVLDLIDRMEHAMRQRLPASPLRMIDARPLPVGGCSKDHDAAVGRGAGLRVKGYKLHAITNEYGRIDAWIVVPANVAEQHIAQPLIQSLPKSKGSWLMADTAYDSNHLYDIAHERGIQLLAKPRAQKKGLGHIRHSASRVRVNAFLHSEAGQRLLQHRIPIEQTFARMGCSHVSLRSPPHHIRRLHRIRPWVAIKLLIYADHQLQSHSKTAA